MLMIIDTHAFTHIPVHIGPTNPALIFLTYVKYFTFRSTKKDKKHYIDNLTCYVTRVKSLDVYEPLRPGLPQVMMQRHAELPPIPPVKAQDSVPGPGALIARSNGDIAAAPSHRRSSTSSFMSCLADSDLLSIQGWEADEVVEADVESEHEESTVFGNRGTMEDSEAVRQWLRDHGSPEHGKFHIVNLY